MQASYSKHRMAKNYTKKRLQEPVLGVTTIRDHTSLKGVASILKREYFSVPRILNRYYFIDDMKGMLPSSFTGLIRKSLVDIVDQQTDLVYELGYTGAFTSRETSKALPRLCKGLNEFSKYEWKCDVDTKHQVTENSWQYIIYTGDKYEYRRSI